MLNDTSSFRSYTLSVYDFPRDVLLSINHYHCRKAGSLLNPLIQSIKQTFKTFFKTNTNNYYRNRESHTISYTIRNGDYGLYWARHYLRFQGKRERGHRSYGEPHRCKAVHVASTGIGQRD